MNQTHTLNFTWMFLALTTGCADPDAVGTADSAGGSQGTDGVTYHRDIRPLLERNCTGCHGSERGIAPFALNSYEDARDLADIIAIVTAARTMPPTTVDASGDCRTYKDAPWLTDADIAAIAAWADRGAPEGHPDQYAAPDMLAPPVIDPDITLVMPESYTPRSDVSDDYRCFVLDPAIDEDRIVTGYEVIPGEPRVVHHVILFGVTSDAGDLRVANKDENQEGPGFTCFGGAGTNDVYGIGGWAPGTGAVEYPAGTGVRLRAGHKLVMQVHYNVAQGKFEDLTRVHLRTTACNYEIPTDNPDVPALCTSPMEGFNLPAGVWDLALPPGREAYTVQQSYRWGDYLPLSGKLHSINPHMHRRGRQLRVDATTGDDTECVVDAPYYDFNWQTSYTYETPVRITPDTTLTVSCTFDTSGDTQVTHYGEGTDDEMCIAFFYVTL